MLIADICEDLREYHTEFALESIGKIQNLMEDILEEYEEILDRAWPGERLQECPKSIEIRDSAREEIKEIERLYEDLRDELEEKHARMQQDLYEKMIYENTIYVVDNFSKCIKEKHKCTRKNVYIKLNKKTGNIRKEEVVVWYCEECQKRYMLKSTYKDLKKQGTILCLIEDETKIRTTQGNAGKFDTYEAESMLTRCGYNVRASENLTTIQRHNILHAIIISGFSTIDKIASHLQWNINSHENIKNHEKAVEKWEEDLEWLTDVYEKKDIKTMGNVGKLVLKYTK